MRIQPSSKASIAGQITGIVLAAGASSRMGRPKALLAYGTSSFVETILDRMAAAGIAQRIVVTGTSAGALAHVVRRAGAKLVVNPDPARGQLSSLQTALAATRADAYLVALVDMPAVKTQTYAALTRLWHAAPGRSLKPIHAGKRGHPFVLSGDRREVAMALDPRAQTREIFQGAPVDDVAVDDPGVLRDIDTPADYRALLDESPSRGPDSELPNRGAP